MTRALAFAVVLGLAIGGVIFGDTESPLARGHGGGGHFGGGHVGGHFGGFRGHFGGFRSHFGGFRGHVGRFAHMRAFRAPHFTGVRTPARRFVARRATHFSEAARLHNKTAAIAAHGPTAVAAPRSSEGRFARTHEFRYRNGFYNARFGWRGLNYNGYWAGGVFWPYLFGDYFSFAFWPYDSYDALWGLGPDALLWAAFWPYGSYYASYPGDIYAGYRAPRTVSPAGQAAAGPVGAQNLAEDCGGFAPGVPELPVSQIETIIQPRPDQQSALEDLKVAVVKAAAILKNACPAQTPDTPLARLDDMEQRLLAMQEAEQLVREPLERLYSLLDAEQKRRLDEAGATQAGARRAARLDIAALCSSQAGFTNVPTDAIANAIRLTSAEKQELDVLKNASAKAADELRASCPSAVPDTLPARLDAARQRIAALIAAIREIRPAVKDFFASLTEQQRAVLKAKAQSAGPSRG